MKSNEPSQKKLYKNLVDMLNADISWVTTDKLLKKNLASVNGSTSKIQKHPFSQPSSKPSNNPIKNNKA